MSRPEIPIDWKKADELMISGCMGTEVASYFGIHPNTFYRRVEEHYGVSFSEYSAEKKSKGESILRAHQYAKALGLTDKGDNTLLIWLGKNRLGQRENQEKESVPNQAQIDNSHELLKLNYENTELRRKLNELQSQTNQELQ